MSVILDPSSAPSSPNWKIADSCQLSLFFKIMIKATCGPPDVAELQFPAASNAMARSEACWELEFTAIYKVEGCLPVASTSATSGRPHFVLSEAFFAF